jgi:hypothetical protein
MSLQCVYKPLPPTGRFTRVIVLQPASDADAELRCSLNIANLDTKRGQIVEYEAISYNWDNQKPDSSRQFLCSHDNIHYSWLNVTANSHAALR